MIVASTIVPVLTLRPFLLKIFVDQREQLTTQVVCLQQMTELAHRRFIRRRLTTQINTNKAAHGGANRTMPLQPLDLKD